MTASVSSARSWQRLEQEPLSDISVPEIARRSGVSLRTIYRYYPTRDELLAAAGEWLGEYVWAEPEFPRSVEELERHLECSCQRFEEHSNLVRAMVLSTVGRAIRSPRRLRRREALNLALGEVSDRLPRGEIERAAAVLFYLDSMDAWLAIREESGLDSREIGKALSWAIGTLIEDLRRNSRSRGAASAFQQEVGRVQARRNSLCPQRTRKGTIMRKRNTGMSWSGANSPPLPRHYGRAATVRCRPSWEDFRRRDKSGDEGRSGASKPSVRAFDADGAHWPLRVPVSGLWRSRTR